VKVAELARKHGINPATYHWKSIFLIPGFPRCASPEDSARGARYS
jgi:hypothetical protein